MIRALAGHDPDRYAAVLRWPLAEALIAFEAKRQHADLEAFRFEQLLYVIGGGRSKPKLPRSLEADEAQADPE